MFPLDYTAVATKGPSSTAGLSTRRRALLRACSVEALLGVFADLAVGLDRSLSGHCVRVLGAGSCRPSWNDVPAYGTKPSRDCPDVTLVTLALLERADRGGSDVRLEHGLPYRAKAWPRASVDPHIWTWREVLAVPWRQDDVHINLRELQASVVALRWRLRSSHHLRSRFVHLTDSQVCAAILTKGRTSSRKLRATLRRWNALCIAGDAYPIVGYVVSEDNPADRPSRRTGGVPVRKRRRRGECLL